ncbi:MAG: hypothetical protein K2Y18_00925 [Alphaproteobacteria bacterium]|jgi:hypothetical protein|nr:hypothetical protein [Alphaproteobacteria bacterium]
MNRKLLSIFSTILLSTQVIAAESENDRLTQETQAVKAFRLEHDNLTLVLGVGTQEKDINTRFPEPRFVFLDQHHSGKLKGQELTVNFNKSDQLEQLANALSDCFESIVVDYAVTNFANWSPLHFSYFSKLLKAGGFMMFNPHWLLKSIGGSNSYLLGCLQVYTTQTELFDELKNNIHPDEYSQSGSRKDGLFPLIPGAYQEEIEGIILHHKKILPFLDKEEDVIQQKCTELNLAYSLLLIPNEMELRDRVAQDVNRRHFITNFFREVILPHNTRILRQYFSKVEIRDNEPFPIPHHQGWEKIRTTFFVCTK